MKGVSSSLMREFLEDVAAEKLRGKTKPEILPEAMIERLQEAAPRFVPNAEGVYPNPFKVDDIVTPRPDSPYSGGRGVPPLGVGVEPEAFPSFTGSPDSATNWGSVPNLRILAMSHDGEGMAAIWVEAAYFDYYQA
jgi:hypothetical protein